MTGRTHDLIALTSLNVTFLSLPLMHMTLGTGFISIASNMLGGLAPDLDQPTDQLYRKIPAGSFFGKLIAPFLGGHRHISHSILGIVLFGFLVSKFFTAVHSTLVVDTAIVWWSFMIGYVSHLIADTITKEGVPWLFPIPIKIGIPPLRFLRIKTGGFIEMLIIFPTLVILNGYLLYHYYNRYFTFLYYLVKK